MQKRFLGLIALIFFGISCAHTQKISAPVKKEQQAITETIETYFEGWMTGDTSKLGRAMHATCQLKNIKDGEVIIFDRAKYLSFFKPRPRRVNSGGKIIHIYVTGDIGSAKCEIETPKRLYTDYFNLMKVGSDWYIVDKIATSVAKE